MNSRRTLRWVVAASLVLALYGCGIPMESPFVAPIAISRDGGSILVAVCASFEGDGLRMRQTHADGGRDEFWAFEGPISVAHGDVLSPSDGSALAIPNGTEPTMEPGDVIFIQLIDGSEGHKGTLNAQFDLGKDGLGEDGWLQSDGTETSTACP